MGGLRERSKEGEEEKWKVRSREGGRSRTRRGSVRDEVEEEEKGEWGGKDARKESGGKGREEEELGG